MSSLVEWDRWTSGTKGRKRVVKLHCRSPTQIGMTHTAKSRDQKHADYDRSMVEVSRNSQPPRGVAEGSTVDGKNSILEDCLYRTSFIDVEISEQRAAPDQQNSGEHRNRNHFPFCVNRSTTCLNDRRRAHPHLPIPPILVPVRSLAGPSPKHLPHYPHHRT